MLRAALNWVFALDLYSDYKLETVFCRVLCSPKKVTDSENSIVALLECQCCYWLYYIGC